MPKDEKAVRFLSGRMQAGLAVSVVGVVIAALFGLTDPEGPTNLSLFILASIITAVGIIIYRGERNSQSHSVVSRRNRMATGFFKPLEHHLQLRSEI